MQAISDSLQNNTVAYYLGSKTCVLSLDCLSLRCNSNGSITSLTVSPCDYSVKLRFSQEDGIDYERRFIQSGIETLYSDTNMLLVDVTVAQFTDGGSLGLQV